MCKLASQHPPDTQHGEKWITALISHKTEQVWRLCVTTCLSKLIVRFDSHSNVCFLLFSFFFQALRVLRAIKPLRALTRSAGMQLVFRSVTLSLAAMVNVSIVCVLFFLIFAILGVQLFSGKFYSCNDTTVANKAECLCLDVNPPPLVCNFTDPATNQVRWLALGMVPLTSCTTVLCDAERLAFCQLPPKLAGCHVLVCTSTSCCCPNICDLRWHLLGAFH